jgi:excinuclease UvrABC nuclease subunit
MTKKTDESLVQFILKGLEHCSLENYMGLNLPKGKHTTLADSASKNGKYGIDKELREERKENKKSLESLKETCNLKAYYRFLT